MEFWTLYRIIRKRLWMVLFLVIVTVSSTLATVMSRPPSYKAVATVRVAITSPSVSDIGRLDWFTAGILFATIQETVLSRSILQTVIEENWLAITPDDLRQAVGVVRVGSSNLLRIEVKSTDPETSKKLANDIAATFIKYNQNLLDTQSASSIAFYEEQVKLAEAHYNEARENFRKSLNEPNARAAESQFIAAQAAYQTALDKLDATRLINRFPDLRPASVTIAEPAVTPADPEGRELARYTLIALLVSMLLSVFIAMGIEYLDMSIKSPHEVTHELGLAVLGVIPHFRRGVSGFASVLAHLDLPILSGLIQWRMRRLESRIVTAERLPMDSTEAFRRVRASLVAAHRQRATDGRGSTARVLVASSRARDGKTTITAQLGIALARAGQRVLLVDGNLRRPELHLHFGLQPEGPGLAQVLPGEAKIAEAIKPTQYSRLAVMLAGTAEGRQAELLDSEQFSGLLARFDGAYDFVIVDSPALGLFTDGAGLATRLDHVVLVVDATRPSSENEFRSLALLASVGARVEGAIINKINPDYVNPTKLHSLPRHVVTAHDGTGGNGNGHARNGYTHQPADTGTAPRLH